MGDYDAYIDRPSREQALKAIELRDALEAEWEAAEAAGESFDDFMQRVLTREAAIADARRSTIRYQDYYDPLPPPTRAERRATKKEIDRQIRRIVREQSRPSPARAAFHILRIAAKIIVRL